MSTSHFGILGLAGVSPHENARALRWARWLEWSMFGVLSLLVFVWYLEIRGRAPDGWILVADWLIWGAFLTEILIVASLVDLPGRYLRQNWISVLVMVSACPLIWQVFPSLELLRALRLVILLNLLIRLSTPARNVLARNHLGITLMMGLMILLMAGTFMAGVDPAIDTPLDGVWWAWVTITTTGYGDLVPASGEGRVFAGLLMLFGIGFMSLVTASFSAYFVARDQSAERFNEQRMLERLEMLDTRLQRLERMVALSVRQTLEAAPQAQDEPAGPDTPGRPDDPV